MTSKKKFLITVAFIIAALSLVVCSVFFYRNFMSRSSFRRDLKRFSQESYDSAFLSMHSPYGYTAENFKTYHALNTIVSSHEIQSMDELQRYLEKIFSSDNTIGTVFLLLDPDMIWDSCGNDSTLQDAALQNGLFSFVSDHPDTVFKILLPYPSLDYWLNVDQSDIEDTLTVYSRFIEDSYEYTNIITYYMGFEKWLLVNPDNYVSDFDVNDVIAKKIYLTCFCDGINQITPINGPVLFDMFRELISAERTSPTVYPDLSDYCFLLFGDSILAYGEGTVSTHGYITGLSGAAAYNYAIGGTPASDFPDAMSDFLSQNCVKQEDGTYRFSPGDADVSDKKLCFLLLYGANDYFGGWGVDNPNDPYDTTTYAGALRYNLKEYRPLFPDAEFIILTPYFISLFSNGTEYRSDIGGVFTDYIEAAVAVAEETGTPYMDNYHDLGINESTVDYYTTDGCHPSENGRLLLAEHIIDFIANLSP